MHLLPPECSNLCYSECDRPEDGHAAAVHDNIMMLPMPFFPLLPLRLSLSPTAPEGAPAGGTSRREVIREGAGADRAGLDCIGIDRQGSVDDGLSASETERERER